MSLHATVYNPWRFNIAPMMDWTDRHCRYFHRLLSRHARLYTEMVTTGAILHGDRARLLRFDRSEHPVAVQLGGSDPKALAECARICADWGYDEINLNVGCPSNRVQSGRFGACLMKEPERVADCVAAMNAAVDIPVTVKCRLGVDEQDSYEELLRFIACNAEAGCQTFIIHARKAWLSGLSPKENRAVPPLHYDRVYRLKQDFPALTIVINGGIADLNQASAHLQHTDGVMLGRAAYQTPYLLAEVDQGLFGSSTPVATPQAVVQALLPYIEQQLQQGIYLSAITRPILGLFHGQPGARAWRRYLSENAHRPGADTTVLRTALEQLERAAEATRLTAPLQ